MRTAPYIGVPLLGRRVELALADYTEERGVVVAVHRKRGEILLAPVGQRTDNGTWRTGAGKRWKRARAEILSVTVLDLDGVS